AIGRRSLDQAFEELADRPQLTRLHTDLSGVDPDDAYSIVPYEKGQLFLRALEEHAGREAFDRFLRSWLDANRFRSVTTDDFRAHVERILPGALAAVRAEEWIEGEGLPDNAPAPKSSRLEAVERLGATAPSAEQ